MILVRKMKFFRLLFLSKIDREKVFADVLDRNSLCTAAPSLNKIGKERL